MTVSPEPLITREFKGLDLHISHALATCHCAFPHRLPFTGLLAPQHLLSLDEDGISLVDIPCEMGLDKT